MKGNPQIYYFREFIYSAFLAEVINRIRISLYKNYQKSISEKTWFSWAVLNGQGENATRHSRPAPDSNSLSACLLQEDPRKFQIPAYCLPDSLLVPQRSTCTHGFNYRLENLGGEGRRSGRLFRMSLEISEHIMMAQGVQILPNLNEQAVKTTDSKREKS